MDANSYTCLKVICNNGWSVLTLTDPGIQCEIKGACSKFSDLDTTPPTISLVMSRDPVGT